MHIGEKMNAVGFSCLAEESRGVKVYIYSISENELPASAVV
jgi:hypothetical protein